MKVSDIKVGDTIFEYTILKLNSPDSRHLLCRCSCGVEKTVDKFHLINGRTKSCGHLRKDVLRETADKKRLRLDGQQFGEWTALDFDSSKQKWRCQCSCKEIRYVSTYSLTAGLSKSCGHSTNQFKDLKGQTFSEWTVIEYVGDRYWKCKCSCGEVRNISSNHLIGGYSKSCGHDGHKFIDLTGEIKGDLLIEEYLGNMMWKCKCMKCGEIKEISSASLRNDEYKYICKNTHHIGEIINNLEIIGQLSGTVVIAECKLCGTVKAYNYSNIVKNISCGCLRANQYTKDDCVKVLTDLYNERGTKPFIEDLIDALNINRSTAFNYKQKYELDDYLNKIYGSKYERDLAELLDTWGIKYVLHSRSIINPFEIDIYIPDKKIAIEINGDYWHSSQIIDKHYHKNKTLACKNKGIALIHLFEHELRNDTKLSIIYDTLKAMLTMNNNVLYARKLLVKEIGIDTAKEFISSNHISGYTFSNINIALVDEYNNIAGLMTFKESRFDTQYQYEIIRLCYSKDVVIIGGAEKMFKYFIDNYNPTSIVSYCDAGKFTGAIYSKLGFDYVNWTEPGYVWVKYSGNIVMSRYQTQKYKLIEKGLGTKEQTEDEIMTDAGFLKIYNCGNYKFEWRSS